MTFAFDVTGIVLCFYEVCRSHMHLRLLAVSDKLLFYIILSSSRLLADYVCSMYVSRLTMNQLLNYEPVA